MNYRVLIKHRDVGVGFAAKKSIQSIIGNGSPILEVRLETKPSNSTSSLVLRVDSKKGSEEIVYQNLERVMGRLNGRVRSIDVQPISLDDTVTTSQDSTNVTSEINLAYPDQTLFSDAEIRYAQKVIAGITENFDVYANEVHNAPRDFHGLEGARKRRKAFQAYNEFMTKLDLLEEGSELPVEITRNRNSHDIFVPVNGNTDFQERLASELTTYFKGVEVLGKGKFRVTGDIEILEEDVPVTLYMAGYNAINLKEV